MARTDTFNFRLTTDGRAWLDTLAAEYPGVTAADVARVSMAVGRKHLDEIRATLTTLATTR